MMNQQPLQPEGRRILYLPHRLFAGNQEQFAPNDSPLQPGDPIIPHFPFPQPIYLWNVNHPVLRPHPLQKAPYAYHTKSTSRTTPSIQTEALQQTPAELVNVFACEAFWDNLVRYAGYPNAELNQPNTWFGDANIPIPDAQQQILAIKSLATWFMFHINRTSQIPQMNSEPSIQDEVRLQIIEPVNGLLQTRYLPDDTVQHGNMYPRWGRGIDRLHLTPGVKGNSGFPDFLMHRFGTQPGNNGATGEVKTWWSCETAGFYDLFNDNPVSNGTFPGDYHHPMAKLLLQVWGQLYFFQCNLGFCTNGEVIMFFAKSGDNTLVLSEPRPWTDPQVHAAFTGLSFAAYDILETGQEEMIENILCTGDRLTQWWWD